MNRVLIIKSGHSESWIDDRSNVVSFGDVFRTTTILKNFLNDNIDWLGSRETVDLLNCTSSSVNFLNMFDENILQLNLKAYSQVINLEKHPLLQNVSFKELPEFCGFFYDAQKAEWIIQNFEKQHFSLPEWNYYCEKHGANTWGQKLQFLLGSKLGDTLGQIQEKNDHMLYDFGLNWQVGSKWPSKQIGMQNWKIIEAILLKTYTVSWQEGFDSINQYQAWIRKNRVLITLDSLGMHLSLALKKPTLAIFTATSADEVDSNEHSFFYKTSHADIDFNFIADSAIKLLNGK